MRLRLQAKEKMNDPHPKEGIDPGDFQSWIILATLVFIDGSSKSKGAADGRRPKVTTEVIF